MSSPRELLEPYLQERALFVSASTVSDDRFHLERFFRFLDSHDIDHVGSVTVEILKAYQDFRETVPGERGATARGGYLYKALLVPKLFLEWTFRRGLTLIDVSGYVLPHVTHREPRIPTKEQVGKILATLDTTRLGREANALGMQSRNRLVLESFYTLGLRRRESHQLNIGDLNLARRTLRVRGKNGRERSLPLSGRLCDLFSEYLKKGRPHLRPCPEENALWVSKQNGTRLCYESLRNIVVLSAKKAGLSGVYPHLLRHACATHMLEAGADLGMIQAFLGHSNPNSTERYTKVSQKELRATLERCHPRAAGGEATS